ncbi:MAG: T9SS type A sorting domain-containing protein [Dyadobacter fermentans]
MKNILYTLICLSFSSFWYKVSAQIVMNGTSFLKAGTVLSMDSLVLIPSDDTELDDHLELTVQHTAVAVKSAASIAKTYYFGDILTFKGEIGIIYHPSQLNGNMEAQLELASSSTDESAMVTLQGSARDLGMHYVSNNISNLDLKILTLVDGDAALPVTMIAFQTRKEENSVKLTWETSFETNSAYFEIQRSGNAKDWQPLGRVSSAGESSYKSSYIFEDLAPMAGDNYYRLKSVDQDGTFALSQIRKVSWDDAALTIFPNPANDVIEVHVQDWQHVANIRIMDESGIILKEHHSEKTSQRGRLSLEGLCAGSYILEAQYLNGGVLRKHFIKY